jgi:hypothetical protein
MTDTDDSAPGWDAITAATDRLYGDQEPKHVGALVPWEFGGPDPLRGISAWQRSAPVPHWHFVTYGLSELFDKVSEDAEHSGYGFELTFRLACDSADTDPAIWVFSFLQNLARYVFQTGNVFADGQWTNLNGPICLGSDTLIHAAAFVHDPELPAIDTPNGRVAFIQIVGLTNAEEAAGKQWQVHKLLDAFLPHMPLWITDVARGSMLDQADISTAVEVGMRRDGSSTGMLFTGMLDWKRENRLLRSSITIVTIGAGQVDTFTQLLRLRLPFGRPLRISGPQAQIVIETSGTNELAEEDGELRLHLTAATAESLAATLQPVAGSYTIPGFDTLRWHVAQTHIKDASGNIVETIG